MRSPELEKLLLDPSPAAWKITGPTKASGASHMKSKLTPPVTPPRDPSAVWPMYCMPFRSDSRVVKDVGGNQIARLLAVQCAGAEFKSPPAGVGIADSDTDRECG